ncbi:MAG: glycoside hydrolase family 97 catalytic domain-containing protein, partial [Verrucomicrobiales bacterium]|nr:glycoside hydrolase family 97 catalytic domain-containing protein [Verrucomicrobiales bacterium]
GEQPVTLGPPVTAILPGVGYVLITEGNLREYSGMTLRPTGTSRLVAAFEDDPAGFTLENEILSPWRVTVVAPDLNALVNSDVLPNLCEPPDPKLFPEGPHTAWIQPGRALVTWCVFGNDGAQWPLQKWFVDQAAALRHELLLIDAGWRTERWGWLKHGGDVWARLKELCDYAATRRVGIVVWHAYPEGRDDGPGLTRPEARRELFARCAAAGVKGVKIDFFNSERLEVVRVYEELARLAAEHHLTINFHGAHKPTGEVRTWPNEITREGIREQEYVLWDSLPLEHYAALPFTRLAVGHADFLPAYVQTKYLRNTTATFQAATAIIATSSFTSWPDHPEDYLVSPFLGLLQAIPNAWDETRVLPGSAIGNLVAFARRSGPDWFVAVLNGTDQRRTWSTDTSFLPNGEFVATLYRDASPHRTLPAIQTGRVLRGSSGAGAPQASADSLQADLESGGGFVAWIRPRPQP